MPEFNSYNEKFQWLEMASKNNLPIDSDDSRWLNKQKSAIQDQNALAAAKDGSYDAGDYIMQKYGWIGRCFGWNIPKVDKGNW